MNKIVEFYQKALQDEQAKEQLTSILQGREVSQATEEQLVKIGEVAKQLGYEITVEEAKAFLQPGEAELTDEDLDAVAGGKGDTNVTCYNGGASIVGGVDCTMAAGSVKS